MKTFEDVKYDVLSNVTGYIIDMIPNIHYASFSTPLPVYFYFQSRLY